MNSGKQNMRKRLLSFRYAFRGMGFLFREQPNAWIHLGAAVGVTAGGVFFRLTAVEWLFIVISIGLVFSAELFNSAVEAIVDKVAPEPDPVAGKIKDLAAGAVLAAALTAAVTGGIIFFPRIF